MLGFALRQHPKHPCTAGATKVIKEAPKEAAFKGSEGSGGGAVGHGVLKSRFEKTSPLPGFLSRKKCSFFHHSENFDFLEAPPRFPRQGIVQLACRIRHPHVAKRPASAIFRAGSVFGASNQPPPGGPLPVRPHTGHLSPCAGNASKDARSRPDAEHFSPRMGTPSKGGHRLGAVHALSRLGECLLAELLEGMKGQHSPKAWRMPSQ